MRFFCLIKNSDIVQINMNKTNGLDPEIRLSASPIIASLSVGSIKGSLSI